MEKTTLIVDSNHLFYRLYFTNLKEVQDNPDFMFHLFLNSLGRHILRYSPQEVILAVDSNSWRKEYFMENINNLKHNFEDPYWSKYLSGYKGQRVKSDSLKGVLYHLDDLWNNLNECSNIKCVKIQSAEADDIIAVLSKHIKNKVIILSSDKDFIQLLEYPNVNIYDPMKEFFIDGTNINLKQSKIIHILQGDTSDNIPPVAKKVGPKKSLEMSKEIDKLLKLDPIIKLRFEFNKKLIDMIESIPTEVEEKILKYYEGVKNSNNYNTTKIFDFFRKFGLKEISNNLKMFSLSGIPNKENVKSGKSVEETLGDEVSKLF